MCVLERFGNVFLGKLLRDPVAFFGSLPLSAAPKGVGRGGPHQHVLCGRRGTAGRGSSDRLRGACTRDAGGREEKGVVVFTS